MIQFPLLSVKRPDESVRRFNELLKSLKHEDYLHYPWVVLWEINRYCNLRCNYCDLHSDRNYVDPLEVLEKLIEMRPKMITISGGEPILMKSIFEIIRRIRKEIDPHFIFNTNLTRKIDELIEFLGDLDVLHTSIDGLGEINTLTRGMSGDEIVANLQRVAKSAESLPRTKILTMSVMTVHNWENAYDLIRTVSQISPRICMALAVQEPYYHPESLGSHPDLMKRLVERVEPLLEENRIMLAGVLSSYLNRDETPAKEQSDGTDKSEMKVNCPRQFFRLMIDPMGNFSTCKSRFFVGLFTDQFQKHIREGDRMGALKIAGRAIKSLALNPNSTTCWFPCKCEEYLDDVLLARDGDPVVSNTFQFLESFTPEEIGKVEEWTQPHLGKGLSAEVRKVLLKKSSQ